jgi:hypothetical protein
MFISGRTTNLLLVIILAVGIGIVAMLASGVRGGPLDPPGPPASTMHTLDDIYTTANNIPQSWDQRFDSTNGDPGPIPPAGCDSDRFKCVMTYRSCAKCPFIFPAVLDRETGLVWEREPYTGVDFWPNAVQQCDSESTGGRLGWRLPTAAELSSLRDESITTFPQLPAGSPFIITTDSTAGWWSSTEDLDQPSYAYQPWFTPVFQVGLHPKAETVHFWCVRGSTSNR